MQFKKYILFIFLIVLLMAGCGMDEAPHEDQESVSQSSNVEMTTEDDLPEGNGLTDKIQPAATELSGMLEVHYIDVDQGDSTLLLGSDFTILVDAGRHDRDDVVPYLQSVGVESIDLLIGTHPHADHIGQMDKVLETFTVDEVWMNGDDHTSQVFERVIDAILESGSSYVEPRAGEEYEIGTAQITILHPAELDSDLNGNSIAFHLQYGEIAFLFTGDAESESEHQMVQRGLPTAQILQVGHHGSSTSSTPFFLDSVQPEVAVYSAGVDNSYGHPHAEVVERYRSMDTTLYGTDVHGTVIVKTDGKTYSTETKKIGEFINEPVHNDQEPAATDSILENVCPEGSIPINSASLEELQQIHQIASDRAEKIISLRESRSFTSYSSLERIDGIGPARVTEIKEQGIVCFD